MALIKQRMINRQNKSPYAYTCYRMIGARPEPYTISIEPNMVLELYSYGNSLRWENVNGALSQAYTIARNHPADDLIGDIPMNFNSDHVAFHIIPKPKVTWGLLFRALSAIGSIVTGFDPMRYEWSFGLALTDGSDDAMLAYGAMMDNRKSPQGDGNERTLSTS